jgi:hypothetical protein
MHDLSPNQIKKIASDISKQNGFSEIDKIFMIVDEKEITTLLHFSHEKQRLGISINSIEIDDFTNKLNKELKKIII